MNKKIIKMVLSVIPMLCGLLYGGGYIAQLIRNYSVWQSAGGTPGDGTSPGFPSTGIQECLSAIFTMPYGLYGFGICAAAIAFLVFMIMKMGDGEATEKDRERNFEYSSK